MDSEHLEDDPGILSIENFSEVLPSIREEFEQRYAQPFEAHSEKLIWEPWTVGDQYHLLRTPLELFCKSQEKIDQLMDELGHFAQSELGLMALSHPWVSLYNEGCFQNFHTDPKHGPWAFTLSLTPNVFFEKATGGSTDILNCFAEGFQSSLANAPMEEAELLSSVQTPFNQLTVFDSRRPHKVAGVRGVHSLLESRCVIHGWFTDPQPFLEGELDSGTLQLLIDLCLEEAEGLETSLDTALSGYTVLKLVKKPGEALNVHVGRDNLLGHKSQAYISPAWKTQFASQLDSRITAALGSSDIEEQKKEPLRREALSSFALTVPVVFEASDNED